MRHGVGCIYDNDLAGLIRASSTQRHTKDENDNAVITKPRTDLITVKRNEPHKECLGQGK